MSTRTKTGKIPRVRYDYSSLKEKGERLGKARPAHFKSTGMKKSIQYQRSSRHGYAKIQANKSKGMSSHEDVIDSTEWGDFGFEATSPMDQELPYPIQEDINDGINFAPPCTFGAVDWTGRSAIERAEDHISKLQMVKLQHEKYLPRAVPLIDLTLTEAREARRRLQDNEVNSRIINEDAQLKRVQNRIAVLERFLAESQFEPERENMRCAINGYKSGQIAYASHYTLIYAGRIVDTAESYGAFTADRNKRLDDYATAWGPHWLWYERGLMCHPASAPRMAGSVALHRINSPSGLGAYWVNQCFWKRAGWVMRMPQIQNKQSLPVPADLSAGWRTTPDGMAYCQQEGPRLVFQSLLDSGATFPSLQRDDFRQLGIYLDSYSAQTIEEINTASGIHNMRCFEMSVIVVDQNNMSLVNPDDAVYPSHGKYLGGLCPVLMGLDNEGSGEDPEGHVVNTRLSGMLPFVACYASLCPSRNTMFLGEDRNDVLGMYKMPGQRRWEISMASTEPVGYNTWNNISDPKIRFVHNRGQILDADRDDLMHASTVSINPGTANEQRWESNPRAEGETLRAMTAGFS